MKICGHCNGTGQVPDVDPAIAKLSAVRQTCSDFGIQIGVDAHVSEAGAGRLLGLSKSRMKARRLGGEPLVEPRRIAGRVDYCLDKIVKCLLEAEKNGTERD